MLEVKGDREGICAIDRAALPAPSGPDFLREVNWWHRPLPEDSAGFTRARGWLRAENTAPRSAATPDAFRRRPQQEGKYFSGREGGRHASGRYNRRTFRRREAEV